METRAGVQGCLHRDFAEAEMKVMICCGMGRSGGTRQYQIAAEVVSQLGLGRGIGFGTTLGQGVNVQETGWVVCKRERPEAWMPAMCDLAIGVYRDPRDVVCSFMRWRGDQGRYDDFDSALEETITAVNWFSMWESVCNYRVRYEEFDSELEAYSIAALLGARLPKGAGRDIAVMYSVDENIMAQERIREQGDWMNPNVMLTAAHIGPDRGKSVWKEKLTAAQIEQVQHELGFWMEVHGYRCLPYG